MEFILLSFLIEFFYIRIGVNRSSKPCCRGMYIDFTSFFLNVMYFTNFSFNLSSFVWFRSRKCWRIRFQRGRHYKFKKSSGRKLVWWRIERKIWILPSQLRYRDHPDPQVVVLEELLFPVKNRKCASALTGSSRGIWRRKRNTHWHYYTHNELKIGGGKVQFFVKSISRMKITLFLRIFRRKYL